MVAQETQEFLPGAVLAGAPKCGTTSVFNYLRFHPEICASSQKETYFLMDVGHPLARRECSIHSLGLKGYRRFFVKCENAEKGLRLEATPDYLYQRTPLESIPTWPVAPRVFFILRRPEERVYSLYRFAQNNISIIGKDVTFREFVRAVEKRLDPIGQNEILVNAISHSRYSDYLSRWRDILSKERMKIFLFEELVREPGDVMKSVCRFLGINQGYFDNFKFGVKNRSFRVRSQWIHKTKKRVSRALPRGRYRQGIGSIYARLNLAEPGKRTVEERVELQRLASYFRDTNERLEREFSVSVALWRNNYVDGAP